MAYNLCIDVEALADGNNLFGIFGTYVDFESVSHIEHFVHFCPVGAALLCNGLEERWHGEHIVLDDAAIFAHKVQNLGLCTACAVYHTMDFGTQFVEQFLHDGCVCTGGGKHKFAGIDG